MMQVIDSAAWSGASGRMLPMIDSLAIAAPVAIQVFAHHAGIAVADFVWERQRGRRNLLIAVLVVLVLTALTAAGGWSLGANVSTLF